MRILIVEDDADTREAVQIGLEQEAFIVDEASDGDKGSYAARTNDYDLIILDYILPRKNGWEVCREVRASGKTMPILVLTVRSSIDDKIEFLNCGADDYLTKPFAFFELLARVRALLRRPHGMEPVVLTLDDLTVDTHRQRVIRGKKQIYLTRKEFSLLEYLMKHKGSVVSRGMIMEHVWNAESDPFSNTIEAHILNVRKKVDIDKDKKLIQTVPGRGYKIDTAR